MQDPKAFVQFRRLLLGVVVELLHEGGVQVEASGLVATFGQESGFRMLWFDNWMRFRGTVRAPLRAPIDEAVRASLEARFSEVWPEIVGALGGLPLADRLQITRQEVSVSAGDHLEIVFDLEAD